ncbi:MULTISPECIES: hypothetical protein [unclassified Acinetobacter]|jgi:hypothetical protein|uniref:hypothetical protein n=1 Tax=unclassified Acinetobacter TaxID=196816 RepID=UPI000A34E152|nr:MULTISPECIES: hypothetical protein [unclassified Acinetobacter]OTG72210.1 hypothetical protein B9T38_07565 [Acinetobacter sp. ANC 4218]TCB71377.1 hypothetical protein E0H88_05795 [Acinetobacter sp. ANC 4216]
MDQKTLEQIAEFICGTDEEIYPQRRSSSQLTSFFYRVGLPFNHDGSTRAKWVFEKLNSLDKNQLADVLRRLASPKEYGGDKVKITKALNVLNSILYVEGFEIYLDEISPKFRKIQRDFNESKLEKERELKPLPAPDFLALGLDVGVGEILQNRWNETQKCIESKAYLASIILMGSILEGVLLGVFQKNMKEGNQAKNAPKDKNDKIKNFAEWKLAEMIDVAHQLDWIGIDVKKYSHSLREFRNLIHPYEQMMYRFNPDEDTTNISWLVVQAVINDLANKLKT